MLTLGLETSTHSGGAALLSDAGLTGAVCFNTKTLYSQRVLPAVEWLLAQTGHQVADIDVVGVSVGPGSFTGIRIGLSVAKALAYASGAKIIGVSTLEALAVRAAAGQDCTVCPLLDARHGQVYAGLYAVNWHGGLPTAKALQPDWSGAIEDVARWITVPTVFAGDAFTQAQEKLAPSLGENFVVPPRTRSLPHPEEVALLTAARATAGSFDDLMALEPQYVRPTYTQRNA